MERLFGEKSESGSGSMRYLEEVLKNARGGRRRVIDILNEILVDLCETAGLATENDMDDLMARMDLIEKSLREHKKKES